MLAYDETHTHVVGPGGCTGLWGLHPDVVTIGKAVAGGVPLGAYGMIGALADELDATHTPVFSQVEGLVVDEAASVARDVWHFVLRPTIAQTLGWAVFVSTPDRSTRASRTSSAEPPFASVSSVHVPAA